MLLREPGPASARRPCAHGKAGGDDGGADGDGEGDVDNEDDDSRDEHGNEKPEDDEDRNGEDDSNGASAPSTRTMLARSASRTHLDTAKATERSESKLGAGSDYTRRMHLC